ncbi:MAG: ATP-binding protein [Clostridia bacterium]|nr:ATP-binding protein [Clostridia bacterium]
MNRRGIYLQLNNILSARRKDAEANAAAAYAIARQNKDFAAADDRLRQLTYEIAKAKAFNRDCSALQSEYDSIKKVYDDTLESIGMDFTPRYSCETCKDTGMAGDKTCACAIKLYNELVRRACNLTGVPNFTFDDDKSLSLQCAQSDNLNKLYAAMRKYCDNFPRSQTKVVSLLGPTGTGKSCVAAAVANRLIERGYFVTYMTAFEFNNLMLKYHTAPVENKADIISDVLESDALFIDDLGSESIINKVTVEMLFSVLDTRIVRGKTTFITSNLSADLLLDRYGERTYSRVTNKSYSKVFTINGDDIRYIQ